MKLVFSKEVFNWLTEQKILKHPQKQQTHEGFLICYDDALYFQNGYKVRLILKLLQVQYHLGLHHLPMIRKITVLHEDQNWMVIKSTLDKLGIPLLEEEIYALHEDPSPIIRIVNTLYKDFYMMRKFQKKKIIHQVQKEFNVKTFDYDKDLAKAHSSIQFIALLLTKHFQIKVQEALGMLIDQSSLLARAILLGTSKSGYVRIQNLFEDLLQNVDTFSNLLESQPSNVKFIMNGFRCGFFGGSYDVTEKTIAIVKRAMLKDWLVDIDKGKSVFLGLERYPALSEQFLSLTSSFFGTNIITLIRQNFKTGVKKNLNFFMGYAKELISFMRSSLYRKQFIESGILQELLQVVLRALQPESIESNSRLLALNLLTELLLTQDFIKNLRYSTTIRRLFQTAQPLLATLFSKLALCDNIFKLLQHSIDKHNESNIKLFYHILCSLLKSKQQQIFDFILENIRVILGKYSTVPLSDFLQTMMSLEDDSKHHPTFTKIFSQFAGRSLQQKQLRLIGETSLSSYEKGLDKIIYGEMVLSIIKSNYQNSEELIFMTLRKLFGIYCGQIITVGYQKIKKNVVGNANNFPTLKPKDLMNISEILSPQQQNQLIQLQFVRNTVQLLLKLLKIVKQIHHQQVFSLIEDFKKELRKKKGNGKQLQKFMKVLAERQITEEDEQEEEIRQVMEQKKLKQKERQNQQPQNMNKRWQKLIKEDSEDENEIAQLKNKFNLEDDWEENIQHQKQELFDEEKDQVIIKNSPIKSQEEKQQISHEDKNIIERAQNKDFKSMIVEPDKPILNQKIEEIQNQKLDQSFEKDSFSSSYSIPPLTEQEQFYIKQFSQSPIPSTILPPDSQNLEDHEILFISHIKQIHKLRFQYLMLLVHQQGLDKFASDYSLESFFGKNFHKLSQQLLTQKDVQVNEFADILIMNSLSSPGVNRMGGILGMIQYFRRQTVKIKGNILVFEEKSKDQDLEKVVVQKDGFKQSKLRGIDYVTTIKNRGVNQKYKLCYQIVNQIILRKFNTSSIENMIRITDTNAAQQISQKKAKSNKPTQNVNSNQQDQKEEQKASPKLLDQQRKEKITARIKMLEKQSKSKA